MKTINKGVLSMFSNLSTFTKNPKSCPKVQLRYSPVFCFFIPQGIKNKNGLRLNYTDLLEIFEQTIQI
jgi:hypothetical protein